MQLKVLMQKDKENTLSSNLTKSFEEKPKKAYFICSNLKDTGFRKIEEELIDSTVKSLFVIGVDKKNTTKGMLEDILTYTSDIYYYKNNGLIEFNSSIFAFEYTSKARVYLFPTNTSENTISDDMTLYTVVDFDLTNEQDKKAFKSAIKDTVKMLQKDVDNFIKLNKSGIEKLVEEKEIFTTRQYNHNVQSISELLGKQKAEKKEMSKEEIDDVYVSDVVIPKVDLSDLTIDIDDIDISDVIDDKVKESKVKSVDKPSVQTVNISLEGVDTSVSNFEEIEQIDEVDKDNELYDEELEDMEFDGSSVLDIEDMLFSKSDIKLNVEDIKNSKKENKENNEKIEDDEVVQVKKVNLNNVSNFIFQLPSRTAKGQDKTSIKIPNYIKNMIPEFFELSEKGKNSNVDGGIYKTRDISVEIVDVKGQSKYHDRDAKITSKNGQSFISIVSDSLKNIEYDELDIARIIKLSSNIYHIEIISKDMQEYKLWDKLCTQKFKSTTRKYGMM